MPLADNGNINEIENYNVFDLKKSLEFYEKALGLKEVRRKEAVALTIYQ